MPTPVATPHGPALSYALPNSSFDSLSLLRPAPCAKLNSPEPRAQTRTYGGVAGTAGDYLPYKFFLLHAPPGRPLSLDEQ